MYCHVHIVHQNRYGHKIFKNKSVNSSNNTSDAGVYYYWESGKWFVLMLVCGFLATMTRSNGVVLLFYPLHTVLTSLYRNIMSKKCVHQQDVSHKSVGMKRHKRTRRSKYYVKGEEAWVYRLNIAVLTVWSVLAMLCTALPLVWVDHLGRSKYCPISIQKGRKQHDPNNNHPNNDPNNDLNGLKDLKDLKGPNGLNGLNGLHLPSLHRERRPWCGVVVVADGDSSWSDSSSSFSYNVSYSGSSSLYTFVQNEYWNQGLMKYWRLNQLPNFILSGPIFLTSFLLFYVFHCNIKTREKEKGGAVSGVFFFALRVLGFVTDSEDPLPIDNLYNKTDQEATAEKLVMEKEENFSFFAFDTTETASGASSGGGDDGLSERRLILIPFVYHNMALTLVCLLMMHVQVSTRFILASSPVCTWYFCDLLFNTRGYCRGKWVRWCVLGYLWVFNVFGIVLFSSFYPWT